MRLSVLNFFSYPDACIELARVSEDEGCFHRYWIGEHHTNGQVPDPLTVALLIAGMTDRIRVGTGALALAFRNPYLIAETALIGEMFYPGRLDIGVTKGSTFDADPRLESMLLDGLMKDDPGSYDRRLKILRDALAREAIIAAPFLDRVVEQGPPLFVMGMSEERAQSAGALGAGFVTSFHHGKDVPQAARLLEIYRAAFRPNRLAESPSTIVVVSGHVTEDLDAVAAHRDNEMGIRGTKAGVFNRTVSIFGTPVDAAREIRQLGAATGTDEMMFLGLKEDSTACIRALAAGWRATA